MAPTSSPTPVDVLVIDDSDLVRKSMERLLTRAGFSVVSLHSPIGATREIVRRRVRLVLVDVDMPAIRGDLLVSLLRQTAACAGLRIVLVSGLEEAELQKIADQVGAEPGKLVRLVRQLLASPAAPQS